MFTVAMMTLFARAIRKRGAATLAPLLTLMTISLAFFCAAGVYLKPFLNNPDTWAIAVVGGIGVIAMGIQNSLMKGALRSFSQTTLMTGNLTQFTIDLVEFIFPASYDDLRERKRIRRDAARHVRKSGLPLLGFMIGAGLGAILTKYYGLLSIALPAFVVGVLSIIAWFRSGKR
jgi:uncharacterized membrane protein YoaK (UPF0700 family)